MCENIVVRSHLGLLKDILQFHPLDFVIYYNDSIIQNYWMQIGVVENPFLPLFWIVVDLYPLFCLVTTRI